MSALKFAFLPALSLVGFLAAGGALASTTVHITLSDKGAAADMPTGLGMGMGGDMTKSPMQMEEDVSSVKAGEVKFDVTNMSKDMVHEMLVIPVPAADPLPYLTSDETVDEDKAGSLGEVEELDPGASGSLTLDLKPGTYVLLCNVPGHYTAGMWKTLTVTP
jgi:uncharacterized cupredoxin-like copper-binding protein